MFRKTNIRMLATLFFGLLGFFIITLLTDNRKTGRTFRTDLVGVDAGEVTSIEIYPHQSGGRLVRLLKENGIWLVESEGARYLADESLPASLIGELNGLKPERVAASGKESWERYQVTDSLATRVKLFGGTTLLADLFIGKFSYSPEGRMTTYLRPADDLRVYGVSGMPGFSFNREPAFFRSKKIVRSSPSDWTRLVFSCPADSSFTLEKINGRWKAGGEAADSARVAAYLDLLSNLSGTAFSESAPRETPTHRLRIEGNNQMEPVEIMGYHRGAEGIILESSQNRGNFFSSEELAGKIFIARQSLL